MACRVARRVATALYSTQTPSLARSVASKQNAAQTCAPMLAARKNSTHVTKACQRSFASTTRTSSKTPASKSKATSNNTESILTLSCPDQPGIVHAVTGFLAQHNLNIVDSQQFGDPTSKKFFMRVHSAAVDGAMDVDQLRSAFQPEADRLHMSFELHSTAAKPRVLVMVSKDGNTLIDLLFKQSVGQLPIEIPLIISNHPTFAALAASYNIPFHHLPVTADTKAQQERQIMALVDEHHIDLVVLARYMQILPPAICHQLSGRIINIHHSFLPSFKGAKPYHVSRFPPHLV